MDQEEEDKCKAERFKTIALQHKTKDYVVTLADKPKMVIFVSMNHEARLQKSEQQN